MNADAKVMFVFVGFAVALGVVNAIAGVSGKIGALIALALFYVSFKMAPEILTEEERESYDTGAWNMIKTGIIPYWFLLLVSWTLIYSIQFY